MSRPMRIRMIPPAILNAGRVMPNILKIKLPTRAKQQRTMAHVQAARRAICRRSEAGESSVMARNNGITPNGSTRKNTEVRANSANSRTAVKFMGVRCVAKDRTTNGTRHLSIFAQKFVASRLIWFWRLSWEKRALVGRKKMWEPPRKGAQRQELEQG